MKRLTLAKRIRLLAALLMVLAAALGGVSLFSMRRIHASLMSIVQDSFPGLEQIGRLGELSQQMHADLLLHVLAPPKQEEAERELAALVRKFDETMQAYDVTISTAPDRALFDRIRGAWQPFRASLDRVLAASRARNSAESLAIVTDQERPALAELHRLVQLEFDLNVTQGNHYEEHAQEAINRGISTILVLLALVLAAGGGTAFLVIGGLNRTLVRLSSHLSGAASQIVSTSGQVSASSRALAEGASEQAASVEETSASTREIGAVAKKNRRSTTTMSETMKQVGATFAVLDGCADDLVQAMEGIGAAGEKVASVIKVIDGLAFQTNILALNAAVEAARAGEAGLSFAVVADEVRHLARRSADAARDTAALIEDSMGRTARGRESVGKLTETVRRNRELAATIVSLTEEVATGSAEQSIGMEQIARAMTRIEQVTQRTAAAAGQSASAGTEISAHGQALQDVVAELESLVGTADSSR